MSQKSARDPGSPEDGFMEPKYYAFWRQLDTLVIIWEYDWIPKDGDLLWFNDNLMVIYHGLMADYDDWFLGTVRTYGIQYLPGQRVKYKKQSTKYQMRIYVQELRVNYTICCLKIIVRLDEEHPNK